MREFAFRIVNVFAESPLAGNPLCVFEEARGLDDRTMQALALQFNLSETTFVLPSERATARVRIFTPAFEMPFAGHPTLGSAHVVRELMNAGDALTLDLNAGIIPVNATGDVWTLQANAPKRRSVSATRGHLAQMLGLDIDDLADESAPPLWVDTGSEQLVIPLASADAVRRAAPRADLMQLHAQNGPRALAYVWARDGDADVPAGVQPVAARFFFLKYGAVIEDPGTGSACANLGGWLIATGAPLPQHMAIAQGDQVGRPCRLGLAVGSDRSIRVSGRVIALGRGTVRL